MRKIEKLKSALKSKDGKVLASNFAYLSLLKIVGFLFPLLTMPYLANVIGVDCFGEIAFALSIIVFVETFTDFGFNYTATRDIARVRNEKNKVSYIFSNIFWSKLLLMLIGFIVLCVLILIIPQFRNNALLLLLTFLYIPGHILFPEWFFQAMEDMKYITILNVLSKIIFTLFVFSVIKEKSDYILQPVLNALGYFVSGLIALWLILRKYKIKILGPKWCDILESLKGSYNMFISLLLPNLYTNFSTILLNSYCGDVATGLYDAGKKFVGIIDNLFGVISRAFFPFLARRIDKHYIYVIISGCFSLISSLFLFFSADFLISTFFSSEFEKATIVLKIMSISPIAFFLMNTYGVNYLALVGKDKLYRNIIVFCSVLGFIITWIFTPLYSYIGVAIVVTGIWFIRGLLICLFAIKNKRNDKIVNCR